MLVKNQNKNIDKLQKRFSRACFWFLFLAIFFISLEGKNVSAATGIFKQVNFQGKVVNTDGTNVTNNSYNFLFCIYTTASPATACTAGANNDAIWRESKSLTVTDGIFQTNLGDATALPGAVDFNTDNIFLGVNFNSNGQMTPLVQFTAAPYAFNADNLDGKDWASPAAIGTGTAAAGTFTNLTTNTGGVSIAAGQSYGGVGAVTLSSTTNGLTLDSGNNTLTIAASDTALSATGVATLTLGANVSITNASGNISFQPAGSGTSATVQIGAGGAGSTTPDFFGLDVKSTTGDPVSGGFEGAMYYNTVDNKFRCYQGSSWTDCISSSGAGPWTDSGPGTLTYLTTTTEDLAIGANSLVAPFSVDVSLNTTRIGSGATNNGILNMYASDGDTGSINYTTDDAWTFMGGNVGIGTTQPWGALHVTSSALWGSNVYHEATNAGADFPIWSFKKSRAGASVNAWDTLGEMKFSGVNSTNGAVASDFGTIISVAEDPTSGSEDGNFMFSVMKAGAMVEQARFSGPEGVIFNYQNANIDFAINGDTLNNMIFVDASTDTVGFGTGTPTARVSIAGATSSKASLNIATGTAPTGGGLYDGDLWYDGTGLYFRNSTTSKNLLASGSGVSLAAASADTDSSTNPSIWVNDTGGGNLLQLQKSGLDKFVVENNGATTISGTANKIVKTTTTDFSAGTLTNVTSSAAIGDGAVMIKDTVNDAAPTTTYSSGIATTQATVGAGSHTIIRDDGQYVVLHGTGGSATTATVWNGTSATGTSKTVTATVGAGSVSLRRPNGKYFLVPGGAATTAYYYDPFFVNPAVGTTTGITIPACTTGTNAFLRPNGVYVVLCGGVTNWFTYNPGAAVTAGYTAGGTISAAFGVGAFAIQRDDGTFLVFQGNNTSNTYQYVSSGSSAVGTMTTTGAMTNAPTITTGAFAVRRADGKFIIFPGGVTGTTVIYDPTRTTANPYGTFTANTGVALPNLADGAQGIWRPDGTYFIITGAGSLVTTIYDPVANTLTAGTNLPNAIGAGVHLFMRPNGQYAIVRGGTNNSIDNLNMGFVVGGTGTSPALASYESECVTATSLNASSRLFWNTNQEGYFNFQVKTGAGACSGTYKDIANSGDLINPAGTTDNRIQIKVFLRRDVPELLDQEWGMRKGLSQVRYRRFKQAPTLYDISVDNSYALHKSQADFGNATDSASAPQSGPATSNLVNDGNGLQLALGVGQNGDTAYSATQTTTTANDPVYNGAFYSHNILTTTATSGTIVMRRSNGRFMVISGNTATANAQIYDQATQTFTANANGVFGATCTNGSNCIPAVGTGVGSLAVKLSDGRFLVVIGNVGQVTSIYDPVASTFTAGPNLYAAAGVGAAAIPLPSGRILIIHGNYTATTTIYDPRQNTTMQGPTAPATIGIGSISLPNTDGTWTVTTGQTAVCTATTTTTTVFDPNTMAFSATGASPTVTANNTGAGAFAFQRSDGIWFIARGSTATSCTTVGTATMLYNPASKQFVAGTALTTGLGTGGGMAIPRADGTWLIVYGGGVTTSYVYVEKAGAFATGMGASLGAYFAGPAALTAPSSGAVSFQRDDGKFVLITGNAGQVVQMYDGGWVNSGFYKTEQFKMDVNGTNQLSATSTLVWKASPTMTGISAKVRTATSQAALQTAGAHDVPYSGGLINPATGADNWMQIDFSFSRKFPSYSGIFSDTWYNGGSHNLATQRAIATPMLKEFSVSNDIDLIDLKSDGLSVFRVGTNGSIYTSANGVINSGGADLAENYTSPDALEKGEIVAVDPTDNHNVKRATNPYQNDLLGVVSTAPGFVAGSYTEGSFPIALVGRVPVNVTNENGMIKDGDRITSGSIPGYGMRATGAGRVIGVAMESMVDSRLMTCDNPSPYNANAKCGQIMVFVNLTDYSGMSVETLMAEASADSATTDASAMTYVSAANSPFTQFPKQGSILAFLNQMKDKQASYGGSDILTGNVSAIGQVVSPLIITDTLVAKHIKAESIEGLEFIQTSVGNATTDAQTAVTQTADLGKEVAGLKTQLLAMAAPQNNVLDLGLFKIMEVQGSLKVTGPSEFQGPAVFKLLAEFIDKVIFHNDVMFEGRVVFNSDTAGYAVIGKGQKNVKVVFANEYASAPVVNATLSIQDIKDDELRNATEDLILSSDVKYVISNVTAKGFEIRVDSLRDWDVPFAWQTVAVKDVRTAVNDSTDIISKSTKEALSGKTILPEPASSSTSDKNQNSSVAGGTTSQPENSTNNVTAATAITPTPITTDNNASLTTTSSVIPTASSTDSGPVSMLPAASDGSGLNINN